MSNEAQGLVRNLAMEAPHKPILLAYANYADEGGYCFPGIDTIAFDIGYSRATVKRVRQDLIRDNWLRTKRQFGTSATTRLNLPKIAAEGVDRGDRTKVRPEFEFEDNDSETAGHNRRAHTEPNVAQPNSRRAHTEPNVGSHGALGRAHTEPLSIRDSSEDPSVERASASSEGASESASRQEPEPAEWALALIADLDFRGHRRPTRKRATELARRVEQAHAGGLGEHEIRRHCRAALNEARSNPAAYLLGALEPDNLPLPAPRDSDAAQVRDPEQHQSNDGTSDAMSAEQAQAEIRRLLGSRSTTTNRPLGSECATDSRDGRDRSTSLL